MQWTVMTAAFLASAVEFVEAFTIVLVVGVTINWRSAIVGTIAAVIALAAIIAVFGTAIVRYVPIDILRLVVGSILVLFGLKWLKKAILRYSGLKALHDEEAIFEETMAELRARGEAITPSLQPSAVALSFKSVFLEGLEVAFIVITFGSNASTALCSGSCSIGGIGSAAIGAGVAGILVVLVGALVRAPLKQVPENTLKFIVGIMLTTFGTFWTVEGFGAAWPFASALPLPDAFIPILAVVYLLASFGLIVWLKGVKQRQHSEMEAVAMVHAEKGVQP
ncbi:hypothetical protein EPA93_47860 [Ktedonosporobacter rubrisoli]|uniref:Uncharacterized protein n=1 Tax=Ktedonosporobacter rubrisoli TaxID=2509675 RepID=A0A4P6K4X8_KTERU|nr:hypothetical protein [Ktedonosporobacter rubrisoli]QBD83274.1 hypothetical protein EPA93_47860 [Ktedonosporobacter rubrisoli]